MATVDPGGEAGDSAGKCAGTNGDFNGTFGGRSDCGDESIRAESSLSAPSPVPAGDPFNRIVSASERTRRPSMGSDRRLTSAPKEGLRLVNDGRRGRAHWGDIEDSKNVAEAELFALGR